MNCLSECLAIEMPPKARKQAQLSLRHGGLGFRSLAHHCSAAYIASVSSTSSSLVTNTNLLHALIVFNAKVISIDALSIEEVVDHPHRQQLLYGGPVGRGCHNIHIAVLRSCSYPDNRFAVVQIRDLRTCACPHPRFADVRMSTSAICGRAHVQICDLLSSRSAICCRPHPRFADVRMSTSAICGRAHVQICDLLSSRSAICCRPDLRFADVT